MHLKSSGDHCPIRLVIPIRSAPTYKCLNYMLICILEVPREWHFNALMKCNRNALRGGWSWGWSDKKDTIIQLYLRGLLDAWTTAGKKVYRYVPIKNMDYIKWIYSNVHRVVAETSVHPSKQVILHFEQKCHVNCFDIM